MGLLEGWDAVGEVVGIGLCRGWGVDSRALAFLVGAGTRRPRCHFLHLRVLKDRIDDFFIL